MVDSPSNARLSNDAGALSRALHAEALCPHCQADMTTLPPSARFCPRCGWDKQQTSGTVPAALSSTDASGAQAGRTQIAPLAVDAGVPANLPVVPPPLPAQQRSPVLRGFANALYRLGVRYEGSLGARHHPAEAERCFFKAAKLGNPAAVARLGKSPMPDDSSPPSNSAHF